MTEPGTDSPSPLSSAQQAELLRYRAAIGLAVLVTGGVLLFAVLRRPPDPGPPPARTLLVYSFTGLEKPLREDLFPAFSRRWELEQGERLEIVATYAGSGWIVDRILRHFPAEVAILASSLDASRIRLLVENGDSSEPTVVALSRLVLVTRPGNPFGIAGFADLGESDAGVVLPDPGSSGLGRLAVLATWGLGRPGVGDPEEGEVRVRRLHDRIVELPPTARDARRLFVEGRGDVLVAYEHQAVDLAGEVVMPASTLLAEHMAVLLRPRDGGRPSAAARALVDFLASSEAQERFQAAGILRSDRPLPISPARARRPSDLGDLRQLDRSVLDRVWPWGQVGSDTEENPGASG